MVKMNLLQIRLVFIALLTVLNYPLVAATPEDEDCRVCGEGEKSVPIKDCYYENPTNGCGPTEFTDAGLAVIDLLTSDDAEECCDQHDLCYGNCSATYSECEDEFRSCLEGVFKGLSIFTEVAGCFFFQDSQKDVCTCVDENSSVTEAEDVECGIN